MNLNFSLTKFCVISLLGLSLTMQSVRGAWNDYLPQPLTRNELNSMKKIARVDIKDQAVGTELAWQNEETGINGTVKLIRKFNLAKHQCHEVEHNIRFPQKEVIRFNATICANEKGGSETLPFTFPDR